MTDTDRYAGSPEEASPPVREPGPERAPLPTSMWVWIRRLEMPPLSARVAQCLGRLPVRQASGQIAGYWLWLPRLGVSVLAHEHTRAGWLCTLVAADPRLTRAATPPPGSSSGSQVGSQVVSAVMAGPERSPTGICVVDEVEMTRTISTRWPWDVVAGLSVQEYRDTWRIRAADRGAPATLCEALLDCAQDTYDYPADLLYPVDLDPTAWTVTIDATVRTRSGIRSMAGLRRQCQLLVDTGLLAPAQTTAGAPERYQLTLPPVGWLISSGPAATGLAW